MRLLVSCKTFGRGKGGVPIALQSMARSLRKCDIEVDIYASGKIFASIDIKDELSLTHGRNAKFSELKIAKYDAIMIAGCWSPTSLLITLIAKLYRKCIIYSPKGQLAFIDSGERYC